MIAPTKPTASSLERAHECPASCAIPTRVSSSGEAAERGTQIHAYVEAILMRHSSRDAALETVSPEWRETCARLDIDKLLDGVDRETVRCEVAYGLDTSTGRVVVLGESLGRAYPATAPHVITGTVDIVGRMVDEDGRVVVQDIKTGQPTTKCEHNWQMRFAAACAMAARNVPEVLARLSYVAEDGSVTHDWHSFDAFDLSTFAGELEGVLARIEKAAHKVSLGVVEVSKGEWCRYCPAFSACPAQVALVRAMVPDIAALNDAAGSLEHLTPGQVGVAWQRFKDLAPLVKRIDAALKEYVRAHPGEVALPDGKVLVEIEKGRSSLNAERAMALAIKYGATPEEQLECMRRAEWTEIRAVKPKGEEEKKSPRKRGKKAAAGGEGEAA